MLSPTSVVFRCALALLMAVATLNPTGGPAQAAAPVQEEISPANRLFVRAMQLIEKADATFDIEEEAKLLREADKVISEIIAKYPDSSLAVQLITSQVVGDFDFYDFRSRIKALVCNEPLSSMCFLHRIGEILPPVESPITAARWDWLSLAVAYHHLGDPVRAKEIIAPFVVAVRRGSAASASGEDLFVARALSMMGQIPLALEITRSINECSTRLYNLSDIAKAAIWADDKALAGSLADEAVRFASDNDCSWEQGLIAQTLKRVGRDAEAKALFKKTVEAQVTKNKDSKTECCAPELAVAASELGDANLALNLLRTVQDENPWTIPAVIGRLARRGDTGLALAYAEQLHDVDLRGESFTELIDAALGRKDRASAEDLAKRLDRLVDEAQGHRPGLLAQKAKAQKLLYADDRWRPTFLAAVTAAERASNFVRRDIGAPLLAVLMRITSGQPMLD